MLRDHRLVARFNLASAALRAFIYTLIHLALALEEAASIILRASQMIISLYQPIHGNQSSFLRKRVFNYETAF